MSNVGGTLADSPEGRRHSYDLTQQLTYFVVTLELVFCGYLLLYADKLVNFRLAPYLFVASGLAAVMGLLWRFCYNMTYHASAHFRQSAASRYFESRSYQLARFGQSLFYSLYIGLTFPTVLAILASGFIYLNDYTKLQVLEEGKVGSNSEIITPPETSRELAVTSQEKGGWSPSTHSVEAPSAGVNQKVE